MTANTNWTLSIGTTAGPTALWNNAGNSNHFDFNDMTGTTPGCSDGSDTDLFAGKLRVEPAASTLANQAGCTSSGILLGTNQDYDQGTVDSIPLIVASSANTECYWDITGIGLRQMVPPEQNSDSYTLGLTLTVTAQ